VVAVLPNYIVGEELGAGAFGLVLAGRHRDLERDVAIKVLSMSDDDSTSDSSVSHGGWYGGVTPIDFKAEARLLAGLDHPHIVRIYDYAENDDLCLLIMEFLSGRTLRHRRRTISPEGACAVGLAVAAALTCAHEQSVLHRDVKPDNVLFNAGSLLKVTDFGIAKIFDQATVTASRFIGTPKYMAPEQIESGRLSPSTDLYALGVILYELLVGAPPFDPTLPLMALLKYKIENLPPAPVGVPRPVAAVLMRVLANDPATRHQTAHAFALDLANAAARSFGPLWTSRCGLALHIADDVRDAARYPASVGTTNPTGNQATRSGRSSGYADRISDDREAGNTDETNDAIDTVRSDPRAGMYRPPGPASPPGTPRDPTAPVRQRRKRYRRMIGTAVTTLAATMVVATAVLVGHGPAEPGVIMTIVGTGEEGFSGDGGPAGRARLTKPDDPALDGAGNIYIADAGNNRIRRVDASGTITTVAGAGRYSFSGDGGPAIQAHLATPTSVALDPTGNLFIADTDNNRIRRLDASGIITTVAGTSAAGFSGDGGPATQARLAKPTGVVLDPAGNLFIADTNNNSIRRIDLFGTITTIAGTGTAGFSGDGGPAVSAQLAAPGGLAVDTDGRIYITDNGNNRVRRVSASGVITTIAGTGVAGFSGDGGPATEAQFADPGSVTVDGEGHIYIADSGNNRIRRIDVFGTITTIAGTGAAGFSGDGGPATEALLAKPNGLVLDTAGNLVVADNANNRVRRIRLAS
jgi:serine/threonine-protein kinase